MTTVESFQCLVFFLMPSEIVLFLSFKTTKQFYCQRELLSLLRKSDWKLISGTCRLKTGVSESSKLTQRSTQLAFFWERHAHVCKKGFHGILKPGEPMISGIIPIMKPSFVAILQDMRASIIYSLTKCLCPKAKPRLSWEAVDLGCFLSLPSSGLRFPGIGLPILFPSSTPVLSSGNETDVSSHHIRCLTYTSLITYTSTL